MYQLYYYPNNASLAPHLILQELDVDFELILVDRQSSANLSAEYLKLNPTGRIPTLVDGELVLFESAAIALYLCEEYAKKFPDSPSLLLPEYDKMLRGKALQWLFYLNSTVQSELIMYFYAARHTQDPQGADAIKDAQERRVTNMLSLLNDELTGKSYLLGEKFSVCDCFLFMLCLWCDVFTKTPADFPELKPYLIRLSQRQAFKRVCQTENIDLTWLN
ncbi:glutathione S-transferase family protein [Aliikangiella maris]|uniref:Glutathione S-transferase family protein n=2 Tax=Aliikangiella maris TaxID=3162458 RepID=A0ABV2BRL8_9GAMM